MRCARIHSLCFSIVWFPIVSLVAGSSARCDQEMTKDSNLAEKSALWRDIRHCGPNAVYMLLRMLQMDCTYQQVSNQIPVSQDGASLLDMRDALNKLGCPSRVAKATPSQLSTISLPAIAHVETGSQTTGHYVLITQVGEKFVRVIDGSTAVSTNMTMSEFQAKWTGFLLVKVDAPLLSPAWNWGIGISCFAIGITFGRFVAVYNRRKSPCMS